MTLLVKPDNRVICRIQLKTESRWICLALSLGDLAAGAAFLVRSEPLLYEVCGGDEMAREYDFSNWQGGVISGARYAFRALKAPFQQVCLHEMRGHLGSGDVEAVSSATARAVARLLGRPADLPLNLGAWTIEEEVKQLPATESENADSSPPESHQHRDESCSLDSGSTGTKKDPADVSAKPLDTEERPPD